MRKAALLSFFLVSALGALSASVAVAADALLPEVSLTNTNDLDAADTQRLYFQLQQEIHAMQLTVERGLQEAQIAAQRSTDDAATRFQLLEKSLSAQRADELEVLQKSNHLMLALAGAIVAVVFVALLFTSYFQWRVVDRLTALSSIRPSLLTLATNRTVPEVAAPGGPGASTEAVEAANARLLSVVAQLQQRITEFERAARAPLAEKIRPMASPMGKD